MKTSLVELLEGEHGLLGSSPFTVEAHLKLSKRPFDWHEQAAQIITGLSNRDPWDYEAFPD